MTNPQHEALVEAVARIRASWERVSCEMGNIQYPGMHADLEDAGSDLWDEFDKTSTALSATAATPSDEVVISEFAFLYRQYGLEKDENLASDALELKRKVLAALEPHAKDL